MKISSKSRLKHMMHCINNNNIKILISKRCDCCCFLKIYIAYVCDIMKEIYHKEAASAFKIETYTLEKIFLSCGYFILFFRGVKSQFLYAFLLLFFFYKSCLRFNFLHINFFLTIKVLSLLYICES